MNIPGPRPRSEPTECGEFEPLDVYLAGDLVTWEGQKFEALADFRAGLLPPPLVEADCPGQFWRSIDDGP